MHTSAHTTLPTRKVYSPGYGKTDIEGTLIEAEAKAAADAGHSLAYACPYPFCSPAGHHFVAVYYLNRQATHRTAQVLARSAHHIFQQE